MAQRKKPQRAKTRRRRPTPPKESTPNGLVSQAEYARHRRERGLAGTSRVAVFKAIKAQRLVKSVTWVNSVAFISDVELADREWAANTDLSRAHDDVKLRAGDQQPLPPELRNVLPFPLLPPPAGDSMAAASAAEKHWRAKRAELDYKAAAAELVDAQEIKAGIVDMVTTCRTKLLGLPSKAKSRLPHLSIADVTVLDDIVRESLEELVPERVSV